MSNKCETFSSIPGHPLYQINQIGDVYSLQSNRFLKTWDRGNGYLQVKFYDNDKPKSEYIHRLVAITFIPNPSNLPEVNHIDGNPRNNDVDNLEWVTRSGNTAHAWHTGLRVVTKNHGRSKKKIRIIETGEIFDSATDCAKIIGGLQSNIVACLKGRKNTVCGYHFEYVDGGDIHESCG